MTPPRVIAVALVLSLSTLAGPSPAHARGFIQRIADRQQSKREFKQLIKANPDLKVYRRGAIGLKSAAWKAGGIFGMLAGAVYSLGQFIDAEFHSSGTGLGNAAPAIAITTGIGVGAWKLAKNVRRNANTKTVDYALSRGIHIEPAQLERWRRDKVIKSPK